MGANKRDLEENYYYDELITMLDIYAFNNASDKEKKRYEKYKAQYKVKMGMPVTREEAAAGNIFR